MFHGKHRRVFEWPNLARKVPFSIHESMTCIGKAALLYMADSGYCGHWRSIGYVLDIGCGKCIHASGVEYPPIVAHVAPSHLSILTLRDGCPLSNTSTSTVTR